LGNLSDSSGRIIKANAIEIIVVESSVEVIISVAAEIYLKSVRKDTDIFVKIL
jgi:hypothetical protein